MVDTKYNRKGEQKYGRSKLGNSHFFEDGINGRSKKGRRIRDLMTGYINIIGHTPDSVTLDFLRTAAVTQANIIDPLEHSPDLNFATYSKAVSLRDQALRRCGVLHADYHHPDDIIGDVA